VPREQDRVNKCWARDSEKFWGLTHYHTIKMKGQMTVFCSILSYNFNVNIV